MSRVILLFGFGIWVFYQMPILPGWAILFAEAVSLAGLAYPRRLRRYLIPGLGFVWAHGYALLAAPPVIPGMEGTRSLLVRGEVVSLVQRNGAMSRFLLRVSRVQDETTVRQGEWQLRLSWRDAPDVRPGDPLHLSVRIKHAHGYSSPGAWDYEGWLYRQGVRYTGYVLHELDDNALIETCCAVNRLRDAISGRVDRLPMSSFARGVIRAIAVGDKSGLTASARDLFSDTGTSHLMAISGLHIGLVAGIGFVGFARLWRQVPRLAERVPAQVAGALLGVAAGGAYAVLAGMSLPTQRALIMLSIVAVGMVGRVHGQPASVLALAAGAVLLWNPMSVTDAGFWLSFGAVAAILAVAARGSHEKRWQLAVRLQLAVNLGLWPLLLAFGLPVASVAPLANLVLVPLFGAVVVPVALIGISVQAVLPVAGDWILLNVGRLLDAVEGGLTWLQDLPWPLLLPGEQGWAIATLSVAAVVLSLAPRGFPLRWFALPLLIAVFLPFQPQLEQGAFNVHVLDVGQGLSVVVETRSHVLVFDTGPAFPSGFSTASAVIKPFLDHRRRRVVDLLVLSHGDNDHAGGARRLESAVDVRQLQSGEPNKYAPHASACVAGEQWRWDGVAFEYLHPVAGGTERGNNASCVLRVAGPGGSVLLTGDIESAVERRLVDEVAERLRSNIVIAPHHGSRTSSSEAFIGATRPDYVVYTTGWANRYGFPAPQVDLRWSDAQARRLDTATTGTLSFWVGTEPGIGPPVCHRMHHRRFWWHNSGSADACHAVLSSD